MINNYENEHTITGGNLKGIIKKIDYIKDLGFNGIYLNPIFLAVSAHKYDTIDYFKIDPNFGDIDDFKNLINELKKRNMKIMLDGVFNHVGYKHPFWQDVLEKRNESEYKDWFIVWDMENLKPANELTMGEFSKNKTYGTFGNTPNMPRLNWANPKVSEYILKIIKFWTNMGIDAWRMDVADEVSFEMWRKVRIESKKINPNIALLGEIWYDSQIFLNGDQFDSSMNYPFRHNLIHLLKNEITLGEYVEEVTRNKYQYSQEINKGLFNLVGSHDVPRISHLLNQDSFKTRVAIAILLLYPGSVSFYYGDEIDLNNKNGKFNRGVFDWSFSKNNTTYNMVKKILAYRNQNIDVIQDFPNMIAKDNSLIFKYSNNDEVLINFNNKKISFKSKKDDFTIDLGAQFNE